MTQTVLSVVIETQPESVELLRGYILDLTNKAEATDPKYKDLKAAVPALHFMSMTVFDDDQYDPIFVLEANFDGPPGPFWAQLEAAIGPQLRDIIRYGKRPGDSTAALFDAVTRADSRAPIAPYLEARTIPPAVFHQGNRGLDRGRIEAEGALFLETRRMLADTASFRGLATPAIHQKLRAALLPQPQFSWLEQPGAARISPSENTADWARLIGFVVLVLLGLCLPGILLSLIIRPGALISLLLCALSLVLSAAFILQRIRALEQCDPTQEQPKLDGLKMRAMARREDHITQNHMGSVVHIKPGILRAIVLRAGLWGLGLILRVLCRDGYLASMRTIHFAHWGLISNGGRLLFFSNFDGSWESYLDDFIEKAHVGLTLAWTSSVGFPSTRYLILDGATQGRKFKDWARHSMAESLFWFSAYRDFTVNQIERNGRIADGLRKSVLTAEEATTWAMDL